jgi:hypothetical protein
MQESTREARHARSAARAKRGTREARHARSAARAKRGESVALQSKRVGRSTARSAVMGSPREARRSVHLADARAKRATRHA